MNKIATSVQDKQRRIAQTLRSRYNISPLPSGSMALGLNLPEQGADFDFAVPVRSKQKFELLVARLGRSMRSSPYNKPGTDYHVFQGKLHGEEVDIALLYGEKGKIQRSTLRAAMKALTDSRRQEIVSKKRELKSAWILPEYRYKRYKRSVDLDLGLPRFEREKLASINRSDVYAHRTHDITPIVESGRILSAAQAADRGLIRGVETNNPFTRTRHTPDEAKFREEIFVTKKLLPANETYGKYGILFRSRKAEKSRYLNTIPTEHVIRQAGARKLTFVVPDQELEHWKKEYPKQRFMRESDVPKSKKLEHARSWAELASRLVQGPKIWQDTRRVRLRDRKR
jgi:hypothetical protein